MSHFCMLSCVKTLLLIVITNFLLLIGAYKCMYVTKVGDHTNINIPCLFHHDLQYRFLKFYCNILKRAHQLVCIFLCFEATNSFIWSRHITKPIKEKDWKVKWLASHPSTSAFFLPPHHLLEYVIILKDQRSNQILLRN